jgi:hypothetical protein
LRSSRWRTPYRGLHVPAGASSDDVRQRIVEAAELLPSAGAVGGWAAAHLLGAAVFDGLAADGKGVLPVPLVVAPTHHPRPQDGVVWRREPLPSADVVLVDGIPVTVGPRTGFDLIRVNDLVEAVVCADAMLRAGIVDVAMLEEEIRRRRRWRGVLTARRALRLADAGAQSPQESRMRMVWVLGGLPVPVVNRPVFHLYGDYLGSPDFLDVEAAVAGEYDGSTHRELGEHTRDNAREERFEDHGLIVVRATSIDLHQRPNLFERFYRARERGLHRDRRRDQWTLDPRPPWLGDDPAPDLPW